VKKIKEQRELSVRSRDGTGGALAGAGAGAGAEPGLRCCRGDFLKFSRSLASAGRPVVLAAFGEGRAGMGLVARERQTRTSDSALRGPAIRILIARRCWAGCYVWLWSMRCVLRESNPDGGCMLANHRCHEVLHSRR
jgi:hypothetical protein